MSDEQRRADDALLTGRITAAEHDYYSQHLRTQTRHTLSIVAVSAVLFVALFGISLFLFTGGSLTGLVVYAPGEEQMTVIDQNVTNVTVTGTMLGEGTARIVFVTPERDYLVADLTSDPGTPRTAKASYFASEDVTIEHAPADATYYFDDGTAIVPIALPFAATAGTILVVTNETTYRLPIVLGTDERMTRFEEVCVETCSLEPTAGTVEVRTDGVVRVTLEKVDATTIAINNAPRQAAAIPDIVLDGVSEIALAPYFSDDDGDDLTFQVNNIIGIEETIDASVLTLVGTTPGSYATYVYASDGQALIMSNEFTITVPTIAGNATNETGNATAAPLLPIERNETNTTVPITPSVPENETNGTGVEAVAANATNATALDCSDPDPNRRPSDCLFAGPTNYFPDQGIYWEGPSRERVARFTPIGNLLIRGEVIVGSTGAPEADEFTLGYSDGDYQYFPTIWVDGDGNLHLRGSLFEENANIIPPAGVYSFNNRRGITLAYADLRTGDLYLRGNIIPYRRSIE